MSFSWEIIEMTLAQIKISFIFIYCDIQATILNVSEVSKYQAKHNKFLNEISSELKFKYCEKIREWDIKMKSCVIKLTNENESLHKNMVFLQFTMIGCCNCNVTKKGGLNCELLLLFHELFLHYKH